MSFAVKSNPKIRRETATLRKDTSGMTISSLYVLLPWQSCTNDNYKIESLGSEQCCKWNCWSVTLDPFPL